MSFTDANKLLAWQKSIAPEAVAAIKARPANERAVYVSALRMIALAVGPRDPALCEAFLRASLLIGTGSIWPVGMS